MKTVIQRAINLLDELYSLSVTDAQHELKLRREYIDVTDAFKKMIDPDPIEASAALDDARRHAEDIRFGMPATADLIGKLCARIEELETELDAYANFNRDLP